MLINIYCNATHASCLAMCRWTIEIIVFLNGATVKWYSKQQNTVESSTFCSELVSLKIVIEINCLICYKLQMMGVLVEGPSYILGVNQGVIQNVANPVS